MEELLRAWDGESVIVRYDRPTDAWMFIALHDLTLGMAIGGCRMHMYASARDGLADAMRLARGMTYKWAALDFPFGGGKSVLAVRRPLEGTDREGLLLRFGDLIETLNGAYGTGVDLGTTPADMAVLARRTSRVFGRAVADGGGGDPGPWTALGVFASIRAACQRVFGSPELGGRRVLVQGIGDVGRPLAARLADAGARVLIAEAMPDRALRLAQEIGADVVAPEAAYDTACDVFAPCAIGGILNARSITRLDCRIVTGSANNQLEDEVADAERLHEREILYAPDFVANAGGAIALAAFEVLGWTESQVEARVLDIGDTVGSILDDALDAGESPVHQARRQAERVLARARTTGAQPLAEAPAVAGG